MELIAKPVVGTVNYYGSESFEMIEGEKLKIKANETDILSTKVPNDKKWSVSIVINITERLA